MGVLECDRAGCNNIMCDLYHDEYGYICNDCFGELVNRGISLNKIGDFFNEHKGQEIDVEVYMTVFKER